MGARYHLTPESRPHRRLVLVEAPNTMSKTEALKEAAAILKDEANELHLLDPDHLPHRAKVAIQREIIRLREIAETIYP